MLADWASRLIVPRSVSYEAWFALVRRCMRAVICARRAIERSMATKSVQERLRLSVTLTSVAT